MKWPRTIGDALDQQLMLSRRVSVVPVKKRLHYVAGVDAAFLHDRVFAAACLFLLPHLDLIERAEASMKSRFPYVPGFLSFREGPAIMAALRKLATTPDLVLFDGHGIAHPRGLGIASHIGVLLNMPTIGCAKTRLIGEFRDPGMRRGNRSSLRFRGRVVGSVLRTRDAVKPLFVSPGHQADVASAEQIALACTGAYRIPEPLRCADLLSKQIVKDYRSPG